MEKYQSIGFTKKTYGVKGELKLKITDHFLEDFAQAEVVFLGINGRKIPHFIEYINFEAPFCLKFEDYNSKEDAIPLTGIEIFLRQSDLLPVEEKVIEEKSLFYQKYQGYTIKDKTLGELGKVEAIIEYPQQEMAVVNRNKKELLIPLNDQLIVNIYEKGSIIIMDLPEGLLDLA